METPVMTSAVEPLRLPCVITPAQTPRRRGPTPKRVRDPDEMAVQARLFAADWRPGDRVMPWISLHEGGNGELSRLVAEGWSWDDVARAMHLAGISYRTGTPISGVILKAKACQARKQTQARQAASHSTLYGSHVAPSAHVTGDPPSERRSPSAIVAPGITPATAAPGADDVAWHVPTRPTFRPVRFRTPPSPSTPVPDIASDTARVQTPVPAPPGPIDADTAIARMFGRAEDGLSG